MARQKVTGKTQQEIDALREEYNPSEHDGIPFHRKYCLAEIPQQPEDYDGPVRFCTLQQYLHDMGDTRICKFHGGAGDTDGLDKLGNMKHGMYATRENLVEDFDNKDQALYDWIIEEWPTAYDIDLENDPNAAYDFHRLAAEIVRAERGRGHLIREGEIHEQERVSDEGNVVVDDSGEVVTEKSEHYLAQMLHRQDSKVSSLEDNLGITRKERLRQDSTDDAVEAIKGFAELGTQFLSRDDGDYDPDDKPWEDESD